MAETMTQTKDRALEEGATQRPTMAQRRYVTPRVDIIEYPEFVTIEAEMPGVPKGSVDIEVEGDELRVTGHRRTERPDGALRFRERSLTDFQRSFLLGKSVDTDRIEAKLEDGVLRVTLHKRDSAKSRKITIE